VRRIVAGSLLLALNQLTVMDGQGLMSIAVSVAGTAELIAEADRLASLDEAPLETLRRVVALYEEAARAEPRDVSLQVKLASACLDLGAEGGGDGALAAFERGERAARRAVELDRASADGHYLIAANRGRAVRLLPVWKVSPLIVGELEKDLRRALALNPRHARALHMEAMLLAGTPAPLRVFLEGRKADVERYLTAAIEAEPRFARARLDLAEHYLAENRAAEARAQAKAVLDMGAAPRYRAEADALLRRIR
jgi:hypothetical protein